MLMSFSSSQYYTTKLIVEIQKSLEMISIIASNLESEVKHPVRGSHRNEVGYVNDSKSSGSLKSVLLRCEKK